MSDRCQTHKARACQKCAGDAGRGITPEQRARWRDEHSGHQSPTGRIGDHRVVALLDALDAAEAERDRNKRGAVTLGGIVEKNCSMILDITGLHDWIDEDGDGDWGAVWENAYELRPKLEAVEAESTRLADVVAKVRELANVQAIACRAQHRADHARNWLDVLALLDQADLS